MAFGNIVDHSEHTQYCNFCYGNGTFYYTGDDVQEFQKIFYTTMRARGMGRIKAALLAHTVKFAPRWRT